MRTALVAIVAGVVSAAAVSGLILGTGIGDDDDDPATVTSAPRGGAFSVSDVYARTTAGIVRVDARERGVRIPPGPPRRDDEVATGTGFVIDADGSIVTNDHVAAGGPEISIRFAEDGPLIDARVIGRDPSTDLALLRVDPAEAGDFEPLRLGDSTGVRVGDAAIAIGHPFGLDRTLTLGVVSATDREIEAPNGYTIQNVVQTDAAINPGNSGGPLLDGDGRVIGVNSQSRGEGTGIAFAVPVDTVKDVVAELRKDGRVERAFLGVTTRPDSARVVEVVRDGPAAAAGVREGDVILTINGRRVASSSDVAAEVQRLKPGDRVELEVRRGGREIELSGELGERP